MESNLFVSPQETFSVSLSPCTLPTQENWDPTDASLQNHHIPRTRCLCVRIEEQDLAVFVLSRDVCQIHGGSGFSQPVFSWGYGEFFVCAVRYRDFCN